MNGLPETSKSNHIVTTSARIVLRYSLIVTSHVDCIVSRRGQLRTFCPAVITACSATAYCPQRATGFRSDLITNVHTVAPSGPEGELRSAVAADPTDGVRCHPPPPHSGRRSGPVHRLPSSSSCCARSAAIRSVGSTCSNGPSSPDSPSTCGGTSCTATTGCPRASSTASSPRTEDAPDEGLDEWNLYLQVMEAAEGDDPDATGSSARTRLRPDREHARTRPTRPPRSKRSAWR